MSKSPFVSKKEMLLRLHCLHLLKSGILLASLFVCSGIAVGQKKVHSDTVQPYWNESLGAIAYMPESAGWYRFKPRAAAGGPQFFVRHKKVFGLGDNDSMVHVRAAKDAAGRTHQRFQQYFNGIPIEGAEFLVHEADGFVTSANGNLLRHLGASEKPALSVPAARSKALLAVPAQSYKTGGAASRMVAANTYKPIPQLVFQKAHADLPLQPQYLKLCYRFLIETATGEGYKVYIDAHTGTLVNKLPLQSQCMPTTVNTNFYGSRAINTTASGTGYYLKDACNAPSIAIYDNQNSVSYSGTLYSSASNSGWNATSDLRSAATSLWACRRTMDFYKQVLNRSGYDGAGAGISIYQNAGFSSGSSVYYGNASMTFTGGNMKIGNNGTSTHTDDWNSLEIIAHEFTHAVTGAASGLVYQGEPGALNESFSDIMGTFAEYWDGGSPFDWVVGEDRGTPFRSLQNPGLYGHPATYKSAASWYSGESDNGGVHINSGVQNYWFYLLCNGGSGTNDNGKAYSVNGIGMADAGLIAYLTNAFYLTSEAQYLDARNQSIQVAIDYFGSCSKAALETAKAWYAVGVGGAQTLTADRNVCGNFTASEGALHFKGVDVLPVASGCAVVLYPAANAYLFSAAKTVVLSPGFRALDGAQVQVFIDSCNMTLNTYTATAGLAQQPQAAVPGLAEANHQEGSPPLAAITAYPNPATTAFQLMITLPQATGYGRVQVYDRLGKQVHVQTSNGLLQGKNTIPVTLKTLSAGTYIVVFNSGNVSLRTRVTIIPH